MFDVDQLVYDPLLSATGVVRRIDGDFARVYYPELGERSRAMIELLPKRRKVVLPEHTEQHLMVLRDPEGMRTYLVEHMAVGVIKSREIVAVACSYSARKFDHIGRTYTVRNVGGGRLALLRHVSRAS